MLSGGSQTLLGINTTINLYNYMYEKKKSDGFADKPSCIKIFIIRSLLALLPLVLHNVKAKALPKKIA